MKVANQKAQSIALDLGQQIRFYRKTYNWTQSELAERAGLSSVFIGRIERGVGTISLSKLLRISESLGIHIIKLLEPASDGDSVSNRDTINEIQKKMYGLTEYELKLLLNYVSFICNKGYNK